MIGVAGGMIGAWFLWWAQGKRTDHIGALIGLLSTTVAIVGWSATSRLNADAKRREIHLQLMNEARQILIKEFRGIDDRLRDSATALLVFFHSEITPQRRTQLAQLLNTAAADPNAVDWVFSVEEHEALFPELRTCRQHIASRVLKIHEEYRRFAGVLLGAGPLPRQFDAALQELIGHITDQQALFFDLKIHVQNRALGAVTGNVVPERQPPDVRVPRLTHNGAGQVVVSVPDPARRAQLEVEGWLQPAG